MNCTHCCLVHSPIPAAPSCPAGALAQQASAADSELKKLAQDAATRAAQTLATKQECEAQLAKAEQRNSEQGSAGAAAVAQAESKAAEAQREAAEAQREAAEAKEVAVSMGKKASAAVAEAEREAAEAKQAKAALCTAGPKIAELEERVAEAEAWKIQGCIGWPTAAKVCMSSVSGRFASRH